MMTRETATLNAQNKMPAAALGYCAISGVQTANAVIVCPEGKENWSGGSSVDQQCGSIAQGLLRPAARFNTRKSAMPVAAARADCPTADRPSAPPKSSSAEASAYHNHPSPPRVAQIIHSRIHFGAGHLCTRRMIR